VSERVDLGEEVTDKESGRPVVFGSGDGGSGGTSGGGDGEGFR
jgi:hypothetical protein